MAKHASVYFLYLYNWIQLTIYITKRVPFSCRYHNLIIILYKFSKAISDSNFRYNIDFFFLLNFANENSSRQRSQRCFSSLSNDQCLLIEWISFLNESLNTWFSDSLINTVKCFVSEWINRLNESQWLIISHLLPPTGGFNVTFRQFFSKKKKKSICETDHFLLKICDKNNTQP